MKRCLDCDRPFVSDQWTCPSCGHEPVKAEGFICFAPETSQADEGVPADSFERLIHLEGRNFWFRSRNHIILWAFRKYFPKAASFFEIGCGNGFVLRAFEQGLPGIRLTGSELHVQGLSFTRKRLEKADLYQMDAKSLPFQEEFDAAGAFDVVEHIVEDERVLAQMYGVVVSGGGILLTVPQHPFLWSYGDEFSLHVRRYTAKELKQKVERAGFRVLDSISFVSFLLPLMVLSRLREKKENYDPKRELQLNPMLNFIFEKILSFERALIRLGLRFPWGGSLLLVARKEMPC